MQIWLDSADVGLIEKARDLGILFGVTTNPSIIAKAEWPLEEVLEKILRLQTGPVTAQVTAPDAAAMIGQAEALHRFSERILIKIPVTQEGLKAIRALAGKKIPTMATAIFDLNQILLAASAGASYVAAYFSRICEEDMNGFESLKQMLRFLNRHHFSSKFMAASLRSAEQVRECADMGADAVTLNEKVFKEFVEDHPMTVQAVDKFTKDWAHAKKRSKLPL